MEAPAVRAQRLGGMFYAALLRRGENEQLADLMASELELRLLEDQRPAEMVEREVEQEREITPQSYRA